jgi:hypothetical protein
VSAEFEDTWHIGGEEEVLIRWWPVQEVGRDYTVFVHLRDLEGDNVAQGDGPPLEGWYPTTAWIPEQIVADPHIVPVHAETLPGSYDLVVGLYDPETGDRLGGEIPLGAVEVVP